MMCSQPVHLEKIDITPKISCRKRTALPLMLAIFFVGIMEESTIVTLMLFRGFRDRYWKFKFKGIRAGDD